MASGWGHALAAAVNGYVDGTKMAADSKEAAEERAWKQEQRAAMRDELRNQQSMRASLADAVRPAEVVGGELGDQSAGPPRPPGPTLGDAKPVYRMVAPGGTNQSFGSAEEAQKAAATYNAPEGVSLRQAAAYRAAGKPVEAAQIENLSLQGARNKFGFTREQEQYAKQLQEEGVLEGLKAFRRGDAAGMAAAFNKSGQFKIDGDIAMKPEEREVAGLGKVPTYSATFNLVGPDGQARPVTYNSHDLSMTYLPFEKQYDLMRKGQDAQRLEARLDEVIRHNRATETNGRITADASATRAGRAGGGGGGGAGRVTPDERQAKERRIVLDGQVKQFDSQIRANESRLRDRSNWRGEEGKQRRAALEAETDQLRQTRGTYSAERENLTQGYMTPAAKTAVSSAPRQVAVGGASPANGAVKVSDKAAFDKLPSGTRFVAPDGTVRVKQ